MKPIEEISVWQCGDTGSIRDGWESKEMLSVSTQNLNKVVEKLNEVIAFVNQSGYGSIKAAYDEGYNAGRASRDEGM